MADPEADLIDGLRAGDESAFEQLVRRYGNRLHRLARIYVRLLP